MKKKQFEVLCKSLLPYVPSFSCKDWLLFAKPVDHILRGFCCDDSGFDPQRFAVIVFYLPLYVPTKHLHFSFGRRLKDDRGCDIWWNLSDPRLGDSLLACIQRDGLPFLEGVRQPQDVSMALRRLSADADPYKLEAIAYSLVMADDVAAALQAFERLAKALDRSISWQAQMMERANELARTLSVDPRIARRQLAEWEQATMKNLGLA